MKERERKPVISSCFHFSPYLLPPDEKGTRLFLTPPLFSFFFPSLAPHPSPSRLHATARASGAPSSPSSPPAS
jgi:hypothetical protein